MTWQVSGRSVERSSLIRTGAVLGIIGSVGAAVGNILHPAVPDDSEEAARLIAQSAIWVPAHLLIAVSVFMMAFGLLAVTYAAGRSRGYIWGVFGFVAAVAGVVIGIALMATDGITAKYASVAWLRSPGPEQAAALQVASFAEMISFGLVVMFNIFFGGLTFLCYGVAVALSSRFSTWLGGVIAVVGTGSIVIGVVQAASGTSSPTIELLTVITPSLFTLWTIIICVLMLRRTDPAAVSPG